MKRTLMTTLAVLLFASSAFAVAAKPVPVRFERPHHYATKAMCVVNPKLNCG
ncbi:MAG: hypothetical protein ABJA10_10015 [Aestuariivirga sp.]